jgi:hypothetical protein
MLFSPGRIVAILASRPLLETQVAKDVVIPAQIRAGRALLEWTQADLAAKAQVSAGSVRDVEALMRAADTSVTAKLRRALEEAGVTFVQGDEHGGPGVRAPADRPYMIRRPTMMTVWDEVPFVVEWRGKELRVYLSRDILDELGGRGSNVSDAECVRIFRRYEAVILDYVARISADSKNYDRYGRLHLRGYVDGGRIVERAQAPDH